MKKLMISVLAVAAMASIGSGAAFAQGADSQAGSAYNNNSVDYGPRNGSNAAYNNSGWSPDQVVRKAEENRSYRPYARNYHRNGYRVTRNDRDGDGVVNSRDRYPDNASRW